MSLTKRTITVGDQVAFHKEDETESFVLSLPKRTGTVGEPGCNSMRGRETGSLVTSLTKRTGPVRDHATIL